MISIALTSFNGSKYIRKQLDSILSQTYQDFELIICDDCSTDCTWQILQEYAGKDSRIKIFQNEKNLGFKKNFEKAILLCKGEHIALSDQDDIWLPKHLEVLLKNIKGKLLCAGDAVFIDENDNLKGNLKLSDIHLPDPQYITDNIAILKRILFRGNIAQGASMLLSREFIKYALPIPENCRFHDTWFCLIANSLNSFSYTTHVVNEYRQHSETVTENGAKTLFQKCLAMPRFQYEKGLSYCTSLLSVIEKEQIKQEVRDLILYSIYLFSNAGHRIFRWKMYREHKKIIEDIYSGTSNTNIFFRKIQFLFF